MNAQAAGAASAEERDVDYRRLGNSDLMVSKLCLGTMTFGEQNSEAEAHAQLDHARAAGVNFFDTAEMYPVPAREPTYGASERIVGNWLRRQPRDKVIVASKVAGPSRGLPWIRNGPLALDEANIRAALEGSLARLQTDYIDLYQVHWPARNVPMFGEWEFDPEAERRCTSVHDQLEILSACVRAGKLRHIGLSNETLWGVMAFLNAAREHGLPTVVSVQNNYHLLNRTLEYGLAEVCHRENVGVLAYSPLAFGLLSGKYLDNPEAPGRRTRFPGFGQRYDKPGVPRATAAYVSLAHEFGISPATFALAWVTSRNFVTSTIIGATTPAQLQENLAAADRVETDTMREAINQIYLRHGNPAP